ncbi:hypothetical protein [Haliangium sp.]|uniref:hypothetical protein n=1 Tax=Haliangium sp. TaxID=2663208 RepID=UPI003D0A5410
MLWPIALAAGCATTASAPQPPRVAPPAPAWTHDPGGHWRWSLISEDQGIRRIEAERWHIERRGDALTGALVRRLRVLSTDGTPFECNQRLIYEQEAVYLLTGTVTGAELELVEQAYTTRPSPCDDGRRRLLAYRGRMNRSGRLLLSWEGGRQTLRRDQARAPAGVEPPPAVAAAAASLRLSRAAPSAVAGDWTWHAGHVDENAGERRRVHETWRLREALDGTITGIVVRTVTVDAVGDAPFTCAGARRYRYRDRYRVHGRRRGQQVTLSETEAVPGRHPCLAATPERHLDAARGALVGDYLVLTWRGQQRQVLYRQP